MTLKEFLQKNRPTVLFFVSIIFSIIFITTPTTNYLKTFRSFLIYFLYFNYIPVYEAYNYPLTIINKFVYISYMYEENMKLRDKFKKDFIKNIQINEIIKKTLREKETENIKQLLKYKFIDTKVISRDYQQWYDYCIINIPKDCKEKIKEDTPVVLNVGIDKFYFVGRVWSVENNIAKILLITNQLSAIPVKVKNKPIEGVILGNSNIYLTFDYILPEDNIQIGDIVVTSGLNNIPEDIEIGEIIEIELSKISGFKKAIVKPKFNINNLKNLLLILTIDN